VFAGDCRCGARRVDNQLGLERTPEEYVAKIVAGFHKVRRVLRSDGTCWLNLGDSYYNYRPGATAYVAQSLSKKNLRDMPSQCAKRSEQIVGLKEKDLVGIPWMTVFALRAEGWYLRQDIIWSKPAPMPESVRDRCTKAHEYIFHLTKSRKYFCNMGAIAEPLRNRRSVWTIDTKGYNEAHFATFPPELPTLCIKAGTERKGLVLDPFAGAGTTLLMAKKLGRHFLGIELSEEYCRMLTKRLAKVEPMPHMKNPRKPNNSQFEYFNVLED